MKHMKHIFIFFCTTVFIGCSSRTYVIMDEYKGKELSAAQLYVAPYSVQISNKDDVIDDLGEGVAEEVFQKHFETIFAANITGNSRIRSCFFGKDVKADFFTGRLLAINKKEKIRLLLPRDGDAVEIDSLTPEYLLFINDYSVSRLPVTSGVWVSGGYGQPGGYSGGSSGGLKHQLQFALWDNMNGKIVSYGRIEAESEAAFFTVTKENWNSCVKDLVQQILRASPFHLKSSGYGNDRSSDTSETAVTELNARPYYFKAKAGGHLAFHLRDQDQGNPNIPDQFENLSERPSVANYFDNGSGFHIDVAGSVLLDEVSSIRLLAGVTYENNTSMSTAFEDERKILGNELTLNNFCPYIGIEKELEIGSAFVYGVIGPSFKTYEGRYTESNIEWKSIYSPSTAFRFSVGLEKHQIILQNLILNVGLIVDIGSVDREKVEVYEAGQKILTGIATGDKTLSNNSIQILFSVGYAF